MFKKLENTAEKTKISPSLIPPETIIPNIFGFHWLDFLVFLETVKHQLQPSSVVPAVPPESTFRVSRQSCGLLVGRCARPHQMCVSEFPAARQLAPQFYNQRCDEPHTGRIPLRGIYVKEAIQERYKEKVCFLRPWIHHQITQTIFGKVLPPAGIDESECD